MAIKDYQKSIICFAVPSAEGELGYDSTNHKLQYHNGTRAVVLTDTILDNTFTYTGTIATLANNAQWYLPVACVFLSGDISLVTASSSGAVTVDINKNGTTIYTTQANRPSLAASATHGTFTTPDVTTFAAGDRIGVDVDAAGTGAVTLTVTINLRATP